MSHVLSALIGRRVRRTTRDVAGLKEEGQIVDYYEGRTYPWIVRWENAGEEGCEEYEFELTDRFSVI